MKNQENLKLMLAALLECGMLDIEILEDVQYDLGDIVEELIDEDVKPTLNHITDRLFYMGVAELEEAIRERLNELECSDCEEHKAEQDALRKLDVYDDIQWYCNCLNTSIYFIRNSDIYRKYLADALSEIEKKMGFDFLD